MTTQAITHFHLPPSGEDAQRADGDARFGAVQAKYLILKMNALPNPTKFLKPVLTLLGFRQAPIWPSAIFPRRGRLSLSFN